MLPTVKDSVAGPTSPESRDGSEISSVAQAGASAQTVALEVRVTVNGARAVDGSEKREPFSETTNTVLVLANGAVIRLSSSVAPGQLLFLTNEKTRKEVICQVVKSKNYQSASGYVELEFTEPVLGFWGMRFPGERHTLQNASLPAARTPETGSLGAEIPPRNADVKPAPYAETKPVAAGITSNLADALQEFKTEIKADSRPQSRADLLAPAEPSIDNLKLEANRLQQQLSSLSFDEQKQSEAKSSVPVAVSSKQDLGDAAAELLNTAIAKPAGTKTATAEAKTERSSLPAPTKNATAPPTSSFDDEEVKIPAWLEPLARNAAIAAPAAEEGEKDSATETEGPRTSGHSAPIPSHKSAPATVRNAATTAAKRTPAAPLFGNSLLDQAAPERNRPSGGSKAWMTLAAGIVIALAGGGWYFRDSLASLAPTHAASEANTSVAPSGAAVAPSAAPAVNSAALSTPESSVAVTKSNSASVRSETSAPVSSPIQGKVQTAVMTERVPKASGNEKILEEPPKSEDEVQPEITKPSLGEVRLAKPKIRHSDRVQANGEMEPTLEGNGDSPSLGENSLGANFAESSKQPAAPAEPVAVGGDVKPARLISSVPPVYPALAKTQHVAGEVRVDALIDANGRVTTMKVVAGPSVLRQAAMDALRQWKYQPATLDGKPAPMHLTVTVQFRLQ